MRIPKSGNFYYTFSFFIFLLTLLITATNYNSKASFVPFIIGIPTLLLIIVELIRDQSRQFSKFFETDLFNSRKKQSLDVEASEPQNKRSKEFKAFMTVFCAALLVMLTGFLIATPIFVFFYILIFAQESWKKSLLFAAGTWAIIYLIFCVMMEIQFPWSYIFYSS